MRFRDFFINLTVATVASMAVFLIGFAVGLARASLVPPVTLSNGPATGVALLINDGSYVKSYAGLAIPQPANVLTLLEATAQKERLALEVDKSSSLGAFVKKIGQMINGMQGMYWQYYVNGEQPMVAADRYILQGGETVLWTFSKSER